MLTTIRQVNIPHCLQEYQKDQNFVQKQNIFGQIPLLFHIISTQTAMIINGCADAIFVLKKG